MKTDDELFIVRTFLKKPNHAWLYIHNEHPCVFKLFNLYIDMKKTPKPFTKDPKRQELVHKVEKNI